jgi:hypothetical protein
MSTIESETRLPSYCRYKDLRDAGIVNSWEQLRRMMEEQGFPAGLLLSANVRAWEIEKVTHWLDERPTARKKIAPRKDKSEHFAEIV